MPHHRRRSRDILLFPPRRRSHRHHLDHTPTTTAKAVKTPMLRAIRRRLQDPGRAERCIPIAAPPHLVRPSGLQLHVVRPPVRSSRGIHRPQRLAAALLRLVVGNHREQRAARRRCICLFLLRHNARAPQARVPCGDGLLAIGGGTGAGLLLQAGKAGRALAEAAGNAYDAELAHDRRRGCPYQVLAPGSGRYPWEGQDVACPHVREERLEPGPLAARWREHGDPRRRREERLGAVDLGADARAAVGRVLHDAGVFKNDLAEGGLWAHCCCSVY